MFYPPPSRLTNLKFIRPISHTSQYLTFISWFQRHMCTGLSSPNGRLATWLIPCVNASPESI